MSLFPTILSFFLQFRLISHNSDFFCNCDFYLTLLNLFVIATFYLAILPFLAIVIFFITIQFFLAIASFLTIKNFFAIATFYLGIQTFSSFFIFYFVYFYHFYCSCFYLALLIFSWNCEFISHNSELFLAIVSLYPAILAIFLKIVYISQF